MTEFTPKPFQVSDQKTLAENNYRSLLAIEPGGGKTAAALLAIKNSGAELVLVVAPQATHRNAWTKDAQWILGVTPRVIGNSKKDQKEALFDFKFCVPGIYLATPQFLTRAKDVEDWAGDMVIIDEGHQLGRPGSVGQKQMQKLADNFPMRLFLSGTAWRNNFERSWSVMRFLWPELYRRGQVAYDNLWMFKMDRIHNEEIWTNRLDKNGNRVKIKEFTNEIEPGRLLSEAPCVIIHKKREECCEHHTVAAQGFPGFLEMEKPQEIHHRVELTRKQKKYIADLERQMLTFLEDNPLVVDIPLTMGQRVRQICLGEPEVEDYLAENADGEEVVKQRLWFKDDCKSPFYDQLREILEEEEDEPVTVYLDSQTFASSLVNRLNKDGFSAFEFSGDTKKTRDEDLKEFGGKFQVAVIVISAGGTGLDGLQKISKKEVWLERSLDETNNVQAMSRQDRLGGRGQVQRHIILDTDGRAEGRMNEQVAKRIALNATLRKA